MSKITIISGDQTGVERAALDAALDKNFDIEGWCTKGRLSEDDVLPSKYTLKELDTASYLERHKANLKLAEEKTLILMISGLKIDEKTLPSVKKEESKTIFLEKDFKQNKVHINPLIKWIKDEEIKKLFISGPTESNINGVTIYDIAYNFLFHQLFNEPEASDCYVKLNDWYNIFKFAGSERESKNDILIRNEFEAADEITSNPSNLQIHAGAIYTSRLLSKALHLENLPGKFF
ncbi:13307_t:CDS:2 [Dentiscutata heterogama]|uniref:13307_t:CDS:1 n=1 Tax=Dentiscutata heterogama TaxID=1316150 RepID=A0ACA9K399_9GLOM|nr:13307_t:CDS:2 [Dentiscutata heterogama]